MWVVGVPFEIAARIAGRRSWPYLLILPNLLLLMVFALGPIAMNFIYSFTSGSNPFLQDRELVGLKNYQRIFECESYLDPNACREDLFWRAVPQTVGYVVAAVVITTLVALVTALVLNREVRAKGFFRSVVFYPVMLSPIVVAFVWRWIVQREGLLNAFLVQVGLEPINFLASIGWTRFWVVFMGIWAAMGFYTLILVAGLQAIPGELYDSASIDGATERKAIWYITLPLLTPSLFLVLVLVVIRSVQVFDHVYAFSRGGPGTSTMFLVHYIVEIGFFRFPSNAGLAATASVLMFVALAVVTAFQVLLSRRMNTDT